MKVFVLGATGATGLLLVDQLLTAGHEVTAYVRSPAKLAGKDRVHIVEGALHDSAKLKAALKGQNAVCSTLGHRNLRDETPIISNGIKIVLEGMKEHGVERLIYEGAYGTAETRDDLGFIFGSIIKPLMLKNSYADHEAAEVLIKASGVQWVLVRPTALTDGPLTAKYKTAERLSPGGFPKISRADVAHFMVQQLTDTQFLSRAPGLAY